MTSDLAVSHAIISLIQTLGRICFLFLPALDFTVDVPHRFFKVFNGVVLEVGTPDVLNGVPKAEVHVFCDLDALDVTGVRQVVVGVIYGVVH